MTSNTLKIKVEFGGGLEFLFDDKKQLDLELPARYRQDDLTDSGLADGHLPTLHDDDRSQDVDIRFLIHYLRHVMLVDKGRPDLFVQGRTMSVSSSLDLTI